MKRSTGRNVLATSLTTFGDRLTSARILRGMTQTQLGEASGVGQSIVTKLERGQVPRIDQSAALARALDVGREWLNYGDGRPPVAQMPEPPKRIPL